MPVVQHIHVPLKYPHEQGIDYQENDDHDIPGQGTEKCVYFLTEYG
jgi:hypothetical protein